MSEYQTAVHKSLDMIRAAADQGPLFVTAAINSAQALLLSDKVASLMAPGKPKRRPPSKARTSTARWAKALKSSVASGVGTQRNSAQPEGLCRP